MASPLLVSRVLDGMTPADPAEPGFAFSWFTVAVTAGEATAVPAFQGSWREPEITVLRAGDTTAVFFGVRAFDLTTAQRLLERSATTGNCDHLARLPGDFHLVVATPRRIVVSGDALGLRRVYVAPSTGGLVLGSHAVAVARAVGAPVDPAWVATWLACPGLRHLVDQSTPFQGLRLVEPGHRLTIDRATARSQRSAWWLMPDRERRLGQTAPELAERLDAAVSSRLAGRAQASADLSGGLDSTVLSFLADAGRPVDSSLLLVTQPSLLPDEENEDLAFARRAAARLDARHLVLDVDDFPLPYAGLDDTPLLDEPAPFATLGGRVAWTAQVLAASGTEMHLSGQGADQVLMAPMVHLARSRRRRPWTARRLARGYRDARGFSGAALDALMHPGPYRTWMAAAAGGTEAVPMTWGMAPAFSAWTTPAAIDGVNRALLCAHGPLSQRPDLHVAVDRIRASAATQRLYRDLLGAHGVTVQFPFLDRAVVETCLSTRGDQRTLPHRPKPLLTAAMHGVVPADVLARRSKTAYLVDFFLGFRCHRREIAELVDGSEMVRLGLVDAGRLAAAIRTPAAEDFALSQLNETLACELWLRRLAGCAARNVGNTAGNGLATPGLSVGRPARDRQGAAGSETPEGVEP